MKCRILAIIETLYKQYLSLYWRRLFIFVYHNYCKDIFENYVWILECKKNLISYIFSIEKYDITSIYYAYFIFLLLWFIKLSKSKPVDIHLFRKQHLIRFHTSESLVLLQWKVIFVMVDKIFNKYYMRKD